MGSEKETVEFILGKLGARRFRARPAFGEYVIYADEKAVALVCDNLLYVKDHPQTKRLEELCEKGPPYPGAKPHFIVEETQLSTIADLPQMLARLAADLPKRKTSASKGKPK